MLSRAPFGTIRPSALHRLDYFFSFCFLFFLFVRSFSSLSSTFFFLLLGSFIKPYQVPFYISFSRKFSSSQLFFVRISEKMLRLGKHGNRSTKVPSVAWSQNTGQANGVTRARRIAALYCTRSLVLFIVPFPCMLVLRCT